MGCINSICRIRPHGVITMLMLALASPLSAQEQQLDEVVVSASRTEQTRFDAPAAIDSVTLDPAGESRPLVNMSEVLATVPGLQLRDRQNFAQDLQLSVRGFGARSTFGVRGVRILVDDIPATMPDGQGQAATASLNSAERIEVLRGPLAQLYGNAAGGVVQVFTRDPANAPPASAMLGAGSHGQRQIGLSLAGGSEALAGLIDLVHFKTDGYREHSAASRTHGNGKIRFRPSDATTITGVLNWFHQPLAQDPLGLSRVQFDADPRQVVPQALTFDTRKRINQQQAGIVIRHRLSASDQVRLRMYAGKRQVFQTLAFSGVAPTSSGGVVDLDRNYGGVGLEWSRETRVADLPFKWTVGADVDRQRERRQGFVNQGGAAGALRRNEIGEAGNSDVYGQLDWMLHPEWRVIAGLRASNVRLAVRDDHVVPGNGDDSGSARYRHVSPVLGAVWHATDRLNVYANVGEGFETPTLAEAAYQASGSGPNLALRSSTSRQAEFGIKYRNRIHAFEAAVFSTRSSDEIVPSQVVNGRTVYQNVDGVMRRGIEAAWSMQTSLMSTRVAYTLLDARFRQAFANAAGQRIAADNRLPGVPRNALVAEVALRHHQRIRSTLEMRAESRTFVDDLNSEAAPGFAVFNLGTSVTIGSAHSKTLLFVRIDNLFNRRYAGSVIVNDGNRRFYEPAAGRTLFIGLRASL